jgi:hypothetical protein
MADLYLHKTPLDKCFARTIQNPSIQETDASLVAQQPMCMFADVCQSFCCSFACVKQRTPCPMWTGYEAASQSSSEQRTFWGDHLEALGALLCGRERGSTQGGEPFKGRSQGERAWRLETEVPPRRDGDGRSKYVGNESGQIVLLSLER